MAGRRCHARLYLTAVPSLTAVSTHRTRSRSRPSPSSSSSGALGGRCCRLAMLGVLICASASGSDRASQHSSNGCRTVMVSPCSSAVVADMVAGASCSGASGCGSDDCGGPDVPCDCRWSSCFSLFDCLDGGCVVGAPTATMHGSSAWSGDAALRGRSGDGGEMMMASSLGVAGIDCASAALVGAGDSSRASPPHGTAIESLSEPGSGSGWLVAGGAAARSMAGSRELNCRHL